MKRLPPPRFNDLTNLFRLASNNLLASFPELLQELPRISARYLAYRQAGGDPFLVGAPIPISDDLRDALMQHYDKPPSILYSRLEEIRERTSPDICPMCGSPSPPGTLDHILPKTIYPEYSVFFRNLVPACFCNSKRGTTYIGPQNSGARTLHPYFDDCLKDRLFRCRIDGDPAHPRIDIEICDPAAEPIAAIEFHLRTVLKKTSVLGWLDNEWSKLFRTPDNLLEITPAPPLECTLAQVSAAISTKLAKLDQHYGTPNNWNSMFFASLLENVPLLEWLSEHVNGVRSGAVVPS
jgi:hypothetical protein